MAISTYPKIIRIVGATDAGEFGAGHCGHCGAECRYEKIFDAVDATGEVHRYSAAAGCIKLFPTSKLAQIHAYLLDKGREYERKGWQLGKFDTAILDLIEAAATGEMDEGEATRQVLDIRRKAAEWRKSRSR